MKKNINIRRIGIILIITIAFITSNEVWSKASYSGNIELKEITLEQKNDHFQMNLRIPVINGIKENEKEINEKLKTRAEDFSNGIKRMSDEDYKQSKKLGEQIKVYEASINFSLQYAGENYMSMLVDYYSYTGGAHGITLREVYNIDINSGKILGLSDIFKEGYDYKTAIDNLIKKEIKKDNDNYIIDNFKGIEKNQEFYITKDGIVIYFQLYEIAPYSTGFPEFKIPFKYIMEGLNLNIK